MIKQTKYLCEAVSVKSYIDFSGDNYEELTYMEWNGGKIDLSVAIRFRDENNKADADMDDFPVILIPKALPKGIAGLETEERFPFGILYVPAMLTKEGKLIPPQSAKKIPWIPRDVLSPFNLQETSIGKWSDYPQEYFKEKDLETWSSYVIAIKSFYETALGESWEVIALNNLESTDCIPLALDDVIYMIPDQTVDAKGAIRRLYEKLLEKDVPFVPLYRKMLSGESLSEEIPYPANSIACMKDHQGQMGGEYPLSVSQRESVNHFHTLQEGEVLAVSGPPGTGKTTLLQSIVADKMVSHALNELSPPVIVATSTNNQAVTNVIDSFGKIPVTGIDAILEKRWVTKAESFAVYLPSKPALKKALKKGYLCTDNRSGGSVSEIENEENKKTALELFLDSSSAYFCHPFNKVSQVIPLLHKRLIQCVDAKNKTLKYLEEIQHITGGMSYLTYQHEVKQRIAAYHSEVETRSLELGVQEEKMKCCEQRFFDWQHYYTSIPWYNRFFSRLIRACRTNIENRLRMHMTPDEIGYWSGKIVNIESIQQYYILEKELLAASCRQLKKDIALTVSKEQEELHKLAQLEQKVDILTDFLKTLKDYLSIDIYYTPPQDDEEKWQRQLIRKRKMVTEADVKGINEMLDTTVRYISFWLAVHYYEAKWLLGDDKLTEKQQDYGFLNIQEKRFRRMAMITPCMIMTFFRLPSVFATQRSAEEASSYLFNYIDLLIVDEAGQVSPEVALPSFALAKKALVVGDEEQIPPVWEIKTDMDVTLACEKGLIQSNKEYCRLQESGLNCAESSIMKVATMACRFQKDGHKGMFLCEHRRCYDEIIDFCNKLVYGGRLEPCRGSISKDEKNHLKAQFPAMGHFPIEVATSNKRGSSRYNIKEAEQIIQWIDCHYSLLLEKYPDEGTIDQIIGIITPFKAQVAVIKLALPERLKKIRVGTIHTFQGAECRMIILSTVYGEKDGCFFIENNKSLMNVAVSRAKDFFFVFGSRKCLSANEAGTSGLLKKMTETEIL